MKQKLNFIILKIKINRLGDLILVGLNDDEKINQLKKILIQSDMIV